MRGSKLSSLGLGLLFLITLPILLVKSDHASAAGPKTKTAAQSSLSASASPKAILLYLDTHQRRLKRSQVDSLIFRLIERQIRVKNQYERQLISDAINPIINQYPFEDLDQVANIKEPEIKYLIQQVYANGFKLSTSEGMVYIETNFPRILSKHGKFTSPTVLRYLRIMSAETARHFAEDAGLIITPDQLAARIVAMERFMAAYPGFKRMGDITPLYGYYRTAYFLGLNNTPAFSYETNQLTAEFLTSYRRTVKLYPDTALAKQIRKYISLLERNHYKKTEEVLKFSENMN